MTNINRIWVIQSDRGGYWRVAHDMPKCCFANKEQAIKAGEDFFVVFPEAKWLAVPYGPR